MNIINQIVIQLKKIFLGTLFLTFLYSCGEKRPDMEEIYKSLSEDQIHNADTSHVTTSISIALSDIENKINSELGATLYEDKNYVDRNGIMLKIKIDRTDRIQLTGVDDRLKFDLPIKIEGKILINESVMGVKIKAEPRFTLNLRLLLTSRLEMLDDYDFKALTTIDKIIWPNKPMINAGPIKIDLSEALESLFYKNEKELSDLIQNAARKELNIKDKFLVKVGEIPSSNYIRTKDIDLWMELKPVQIILAKRPFIKKDTLTMRVGIEVQFELLTEKVDSSFIDLTTLKCIAKKEISDDFHLSIMFTMPYRMLDSLFALKIGTLDSTKIPKKYLFDSPHIGKYGEQAVWLMAEIYQPAEGLLFNTGRMAYDSLNKTLILEEMNTSFYGNNILVDFLFDTQVGKVKSTIQKSLKWPITPLFEKVQIAVKKVIRKLSKNGQLNIEFEDMDFEVTEIVPERDEIIFKISVTGKSDLNLSL